MKLQIEESYYSRENLIMELTTLKELAQKNVHQYQNDQNNNHKNK